MSNRSGSTGASCLPAASSCTLQHYRPPVLWWGPRHTGLCHACGQTPATGDSPASVSPQDSVCWSSQRTS